MCLQSRSRDTDVNNKYKDVKEGKQLRMNWEIGIDIYTLVCADKNENLLHSTGSSSQRKPKWEGNLKRRHVCGHTVDSLCCTADTNTALQSIYILQ